MKILHLNLKKKWFDMIRSGEKLEEYREIKDYWIQRLIISQYNLKNSIFENFSYNLANPYLNYTGPKQVLRFYNAKFKTFDVVNFKNGFKRGGRNAPEMTFKIKEICIDQGDTMIGAPFDEFAFIIKLGEEMYPCKDCGKLRTKAEGGTTFTVCDTCWDKIHV